MKYLTLFRLNNDFDSCVNQQVLPEWLTQERLDYIQKFILKNNSNLQLSIEDTLYPEENVVEARFFEYSQEKKSKTLFEKIATFFTSWYDKGSNGVSSRTTRNRRKNRRKQKKTVGA